MNSLSASGVGSGSVGIRSGLLSGLLVERWAAPRQPSVGGVSFISSDFFDPLLHRGDVSDQLLGLAPLPCLLDLGAVVFVQCDLRIGEGLLPLPMLFSRFALADKATLLGIGRAELKLLERW